jgi:hypothetical protein
LHDPIIVGSFLTQKVQSVHIVMPVIRFYPSGTSS